MAEKKKKSNEKEETKVDAKTVTEEFKNLSVEEKDKAFEKLSEQYEMLKSIVKELSDQNTELENKAKEFDGKVAELEAKAVGKVSDETYMRLAADFDNFKRRNATAVSNSYSDGKIEVIKSILPVEDNIERAIASITDESSRKGVELIKRQFDDILKKLNVVEIESLNAPFDPELHNAVMQCEAEKPEDADKCVEVFQKGYTMDGKVIRYSFVKVAK